MLNPMKLKKRSLSPMKLKKRMLSPMKHKAEDVESYETKNGGH